MSRVKPSIRISPVIRGGEVRIGVFGLTKGPATFGSIDGAMGWIEKKLKTKEKNGDKA